MATDLDFSKQDLIRRLSESPEPLPAYAAVAVQYDAAGVAQQLFPVTGQTPVALLERTHREALPLLAHGTWVPNYVRVAGEWREYVPAR